MSIFSFIISFPSSRIVQYQPTDFAGLAQETEQWNCSIVACIRMIHYPTPKKKRRTRRHRGSALTDGYRHTTTLPSKLSHIHQLHVDAYLPSGYYGQKGRYGEEGGGKYTTCSQAAGEFGENEACLESRKRFQSSHVVPSNRNWNLGQAGLSPDAKAMLCKLLMAPKDRPHNRHICYQPEQGHKRRKVPRRPAM